MIGRPWRSAGAVPSASPGGGGRRPPLERSGWGRTGTYPAVAPGQVRPAVQVPPEPMPLIRSGRPLKEWTYAGIFAPDLMISAGRAQVGGVPQSFWAVWDRRRGVLETETLLVAARRVEVSDREMTVRSGPARLEVAFTPVGDPVEVVSPHGRSYIWTRKTPVRADGHLTLGMEVRPVSALGLLDQSAGYHARVTEWEWSAGVGTTVDGWPVVWNLVRGIHDAESMSERTVWVDGHAVEAPPVRFAADLDELWGDDGSLLCFEEEGARLQRIRLGLLSSDYVQPFGRFHGRLPGGVELSEHEPALGVMERHRARW